MHLFGSSYILFLFKSSCGPKFIKKDAVIYKSILYKRHGFISYGHL